MKLKYYGHACFSLRYQDGTLLVTDPFDATVPYPPCDEKCTAALVTHDHFDHNCVTSLPGEFKTINAAGTYQIGGVTVRTAECFHDDQRGALRGNNLIFRIEGDGLSIAHLGDLGHMPEEAQREILTGLDVMLIPVGGYFTIDTPQAVRIIREFKPRLAIAMHYRTDVIPDWSISTQSDFIRETGAMFLPREIEISRETLETLPSFAVMAYK